VLQKVRQQLTNALHNKPHGKPADNATPAALPTTLRIATPAAPRPQKPIDIWGNPTENATWAECLSASANQEQQHDKPFTTVMRKNKKPTPVTIIPKALPRIEREVIITCGKHLADAERTTFADFALNRVNHMIRNSADIPLPPFILARINSNNKLALTTNPTTPATTYASYLQMLTANIKSLQPPDPCINRCWTKFLVHNVPTKARLPAVKAEIETMYPSLHLAQEPS
jgi:hypothetical protein